MAYFIDPETLDEIRDRADIVEVVSEHVQLKRAGSSYQGLCPFHSEKTPSFSVSPNKRLFKCFGCGEGGDAITFVMKVEGLTFPEAAKKLADRYGVQVREQTSGYKGDDKKKPAYELNRKVALFFMENLGKNKHAIKYLYDRGIKIEFIKKYGIGYADDSWDGLTNFLKREKADLELAESLGLIGKKKQGNGYYDVFRGRVIFPIIDTKSRVIGFGGRVIGEGMPKYLNSPESLIFNKGYNLYGLNYFNRARKSENVIVVEGYMDVISLGTHGIGYCVASLGTALTVNQVKELQKYGNNFLLCYDGDRAGINATKRAIQIFDSLNMKVKVIKLKDGLDPDDFIKKYGRLRFESEVKNAISSQDFLIDDFKAGLNLDDVDDRIELIKFISNIILRIKSPIERDVHISRLAEAYGVSVDAIRTEMAGGVKVKSGEVSPVGKPVERKRPSSKQDKVALELIKIMLYDKNFCGKIMQEIKIDDFKNPIMKEMARTIEKVYEDSDTIDLAEMVEYFVTNHIVDEKTANQLLEENGRYSDTNIGELIDELLYTFEKSDMNVRRREIIKEISNIESIEQKDEELKMRLNDLIRDLIEINAEIERQTNIYEGD